VYGATVDSGAVKLPPKLVAPFALALILTACQSAPPPLAFEHSTRVAVRRIGIAPLGVPEQLQVKIMNPIGAGFGVVGNLIESHRTATASAEVTGVLSKAHYNFGSALSDAIAVAMRKAGFTVTCVDGSRTKSEREKFLSRYPQQKAQVDAYLDVYSPYFGFQAPQSSADYRPRVELIARLVSSRDGSTLFQNHIVYGTHTSDDEDAILVRADDNVSFRDRTALEANPASTARALQSAIDSIAWELAKQFM
jgi:hypothetical protein